MRFTSSLLTLLALALAGAVRADILRLKNGDTLTGKVTKQEAGKVYFHGTYFGDVVLNEGDVAAFKLGDNVTAADLAAAPAPAAAPAAATTGTAASAGSANFQGQAADPNKPVWTRSLSFGGSYNSAMFEQGQLKGAPPGTTGAALNLPGRNYAWQGNATFIRTTQRDAHSLELTSTFSEAQPAGKQADTYSGVFAWNHKLGARTYTVSRTSYMVDNVKNIDYSAVQLAGLGYKVVDTQQTKFDVIPGVLLMREKKGNQYDDETIFGAGFAQSLTYYFNAYASLDQKVFYRRSLKDSEQYILDAYIGFKGMLSAKLGVTFGITYVYDNTLGPLPAPYSAVIAQKKDLIQTTYGFQYKF